MVVKDFQAAIKFDGNKIKCLGASVVDTSYLSATCNSNLGTNSYALWRTKPGNTHTEAYNKTIGQVTFKFQKSPDEATISFDRPFTFAKNVNNQNLNLSLPTTKYETHSSHFQLK